MNATDHDNLRDLEATLVSVRASLSRATADQAFGSDLGAAVNLRLAVTYLRDLQGMAASLADDLADALADRCKKVPA